MTERVILLRGSLGPGDGVINQHRAVVSTFGNPTRLRLGREWIGGVDEHHGDAIAFGPIKGLDCDSVCHGAFLRNQQRVGILFRSLSAVIRLDHSEDRFSRVERVAH